jgi:hypothetical protein
MSLAPTLDCKKTLAARYEPSRYALHAASRLRLVNLLVPFTPFKANLMRRSNRAVTPFLPLRRQNLKREGKLTTCSLVYPET